GDWTSLIGLHGVRDLLAPWPWAWPALLLALLLGAAAIANFVTKRILLRGLRRLLAMLASQTGQAGIADMRVIPRLAHAVPAMVISSGLGWTPDLSPALVAVVHGTCQAWVARALPLARSHALDAADGLYERRPDARNKPIKGYRQVARIVVFALAGLSIVAALAGVKLLHLLTGLGAATAVLMLVFQDTLLSLVASV